MPNTRNMVAWAISGGNSFSPGNFHGQKQSKIVGHDDKTMGQPLTRSL